MSSRRRLGEIDRGFISSPTCDYARAFGREQWLWRQSRRESIEEGGSASPSFSETLFYSFEHYSAAEYYSGGKAQKNWLRFARHGRHLVAEALRGSVHTAQDAVGDDGRKTSGDRLPGDG